MNLTRTSWPLGWLPSDDEYNGRKEGLAKMDNLQLDENGNISICRAYNKINTNQFEGYVHSCYSKYFTDTKYRYVGLNTGKVLKSSGNFISSTEILTNGHPNSAAFASVYGEVIVCSATQRKRDNNSGTIRNLGVETPATALTLWTNLDPQQRPRKDISDLDGNGFYTNWEDIQTEAGSFSNSSSYCQFNCESESGQGVIQDVYSGPIDYTALSDGSIGTDDDTIQFNIRIGDTTKLKWVRIEFFMDNITHGLFEFPASYFHYTWDNESIDKQYFVQGQNVWTHLQVSRKDFDRAFDYEGRDWRTIYGIRIVVQATSNITCVVTEFEIVGGTKGPLTGWYKYRQVNVYNANNCVHRSPLGPDMSQPIYLENGYVNIDPVIPTNINDVNEIWIYRKSGDVNIDVTPIGEQPKLDRWYRVLVIAEVGGTFPTTADQMSDEDVLLQGESVTGIVANENLISAASSGITDDIFDIITDYFERCLYLTYKDIFLSEKRNPDAVDSSISIKLSGDTTERNLWIRKIGEAEIYVGTSKDIYSIRGTLDYLPDETIDAIIRPLGIKFPPLGTEAVVDAGTIFYMASDGWRAIQGSETRLVSEPLNLLFQGYNRYGKSSISFLPLDQIAYPCAIAKGKFWASCYSADESRPLFVYDFSTNASANRPNYWYYYNTNPICLFTEEDGKLLGGYGNVDDYYLRELDVGSLVDGVTKLVATLETFYDDNNQPRNRKDVFTFKFSLDTGNDPVTLHISKDGGTWTEIGSYSFNGKSEQLIEIATTVGIGFRYGIRLSGSFSTFKLYNFSIEYEPRPEQLNYFRIPNSNLGTYSRKRFVNYAFVIDTLGNNVTFTPYVDNVVQTTSTVNLNYNGRGTYVHYFTAETLGTDIGGILSGNIFEFYQILLEEIISEKLPVPVKYLVIPAEDYGTPNRKRHSSYKFQINTRGQDVTFTPRLDGVNKTASTANTSEKRIHEHFFTTDTIAKDIGGTLETAADTPFEFYGVIRPQDLEILPPRLKEFRIPETNYDIAAKKRIRTMPMIINTNGYDVTFTPIVDGVNQTVTTLNTATKKTAFHYFITDVFGVDYSGELTGSQPFEFYGLQKPEEVEIIPVGKKFDQVGPVHLNKIGKLVRFRIRLIATGTSLPFNIYAEDTSIYTGTIQTTANIDKVYEVCIPKSKNATICRIEFGPADVFHRYYVDFDINYGGVDSEIKKIRVGYDPDLPRR